MKIVEFLEARIAEDEAAAERGGYHNGGGTFSNDNYGCLLIQPARILAECAAKRAIIERQRAIWEQAMDVTLNDIEDDANEGLDFAIRALAAVYADHPDYREEWRHA